MSAISTPESAQVLDIPVLTREYERRIAPRKVISLKATLQLPDGTDIDGLSVDISHTGIGLFSPRQLETDDDCKIGVDLSACGSSTELRFVGRVCYCGPHPDGKFRVGMRFVGLAPGAAKLLKELLS